MTEAYVTHPYSGILIEFPDKDKYEILINNWLMVSVNKGDITKEKVDAITNSSNDKLIHGEGLALKILSSGGP